MKSHVIISPNLIGQFYWRLAMGKKSRGRADLASAGEFNRQCMACHIPHEKSVERNTRLCPIFLPTLFSCSSHFLRGLQQNIAQSRLLYLLSRAQVVSGGNWLKYDCEDQFVTCLNTVIILSWHYEGHETSEKQRRHFDETCFRRKMSHIGIVAWILLGQRIVTR